MNSQADLDPNTSAGSPQAAGKARERTKRSTAGASGAPTNPADPMSSGVADLVQQVGAEAKRTVVSLASEAQAQIRETLDAQVQAGAKTVAEIAESTKIAAEHLESDAPRLADLVHLASDRMDEVARNIEQQSAADLLRATSDFIRRNPGLAFGAAAAVGFGLVRLLKSGARDDAAGPHADSDDVEAWQTAVQ